MDVVSKAFLIRPCVRIDDLKLALHGFADLDRILFLFAVDDGSGIDGTLFFVDWALVKKSASVAPLNRSDSFGISSGSTALYRTTSTASSFSVCTRFRAVALEGVIAFRLLADFFTVRSGSRGYSAAADPNLVVDILLHPPSEEKPSTE